MHSANTLYIKWTIEVTNALNLGLELNESAKPTKCYPNHPFCIFAQTFPYSFELIWTNPEKPATNSPPIVPIVCKVNNRSHKLNFTVPNPHRMCAWGSKLTQKNRNSPETSGQPRQHCYSLIQYVCRLMGLERDGNLFSLHLLSALKAPSFVFFRHSRSTSSRVAHRKLSFSVNRFRKSVDMFSMKVCRNRSCREFLREARRTISKTSTDKNSDAISRAQDHKLNVESDSNGSYSRWKKQMHHNNIRWELNETWCLGNYCNAPVAGIKGALQPIRFRVATVEVAQGFTRSVWDLIEHWYAA